MSIIAGHDADKMKNTLKKVWNALAFLDINTDNGFSKTKQLKNTDLEKKSGLWMQREGEKIPTGWQSTVKGINAKDPQSLRGDRADLLILDEAGSWKDLLKAYVQGQALINIGGVKFGIAIVGGTGGDSGASLEGLKEIYYHPEVYGVLPYKHSYTQTGEVALTGFFIPAFEQVFRPGYIDKRGFCDPDKTKPLLQKDRDMFLDSPQGMLHHCAEYCWNAEEAFNLEGENKFNKVLLSNQLAEIRLHKRGPRPIAGYLDYIFKGDQKSYNNILGFNWKPDKGSKLQILEHPIWTDLYQEVDENNVSIKYQEMSNLYIAGVDGIDIGANDTSSETRNASDFCIVIKKRAFGLKDPKIVAIYKDRPGDIREAYKVALKLLQYYNAKVNIEATRKSFYTWAKEHKQDGFFVRRPKNTLTSDFSRTLSNQVGTPATPAIIDQHTTLTASFVEDYSHTIWFEEMLQELISYNDENKGRFDIVAALGMVNLLDQELSARIPTEVKKEEEEFPDYGYYYDSQGRKRFGVIPKTVNQEFQLNIFQSDDPYRIETSDPRLYERVIQG